MDPTGLECYIIVDPNTFHDTDVYVQAMIEDFEAVYGETPTILEVTTVDEFNTAWQSIGGSADAIAIFAHSQDNLYQFSGKNGNKENLTLAGILGLQPPKDIGSLYLLGCNTQHSGAENNVATTFAANNNIHNLFASDGTLVHSVGAGGYMLSSKANDSWYARWNRNNPNNPIDPPYRALGPFERLSILSTFGPNLGILHNSEPIGYNMPFRDLLEIGYESAPDVSENSVPALQMLPPAPGKGRGNWLGSDWAPAMDKPRMMWIGSDYVQVGWM